MIFWDPAPHSSFEEFEESGLADHKDADPEINVRSGEMYVYMPGQDRERLEKFWAQQTGWSLGPPNLLSTDCTGRKIVEFMMKPGDIVLVLDVRKDEVLGFISEVLVRGTRGLIWFGHPGVMEFRVQQFVRVDSDLDETHTETPTGDDLWEIGA